MSLSTVELNERVIRRHCAIGSGVVRVVGPRGCGKTSCVLRALNSPPSTTRDAATALNTAPLVVYVSCTSCGDLRELAHRVSNELTWEEASPNKPSEARGPTVMKDVTDALLTAIDKHSHVHVIIDDVDAVLCPASTGEVCDSVGQWLASARYSRKLTFWLLACTDFAVPHASRLAVLASPSNEEKASWVRSAAQPGSQLGVLAAEVGGLAVRVKPLRDTTFASDIRRVISRCDAICSTAPPGVVQSFNEGTESTKLKHAIDVWYNVSSAPGGAGSSAVVMTTAAKILFVAAFMAGALTKTQLLVVLGDGVSSVSRRHSRGGAAAAVKPGSQSFTIARLSLAYDALARMSRDGSGRTPPPSAVALHHLAAMEAQGCLSRSSHNHAMYHCRASYEESAAMASSLGMDLSQLLPTRV